MDYLKERVRILLFPTSSLEQLTAFSFLGLLAAAAYAGWAYEQGLRLLREFQVPGWLATETFSNAFAMVFMGGFLLFLIVKVFIPLFLGRLETGRPQGTRLSPFIYLLMILGAVIGGHPHPMLLLYFAILFLYGMVYMPSLFEVPPTYQITMVRLDPRMSLATLIICGAAFYYYFAHIGLNPVSALVSAFATFCLALSVYRVTQRQKPS